MSDPTLGPVVTPRTIVLQAPLSMGFSSQEYWSSRPCPSTGDLPDPGTEPRSSELWVDSLPSEPPRKTSFSLYFKYLVFKVKWVLSNSGLFSHITLSESESEVAQSCLTLCNLADCSLPGSSVHGIFQAIVLEWIAISFSRGSSRPRDWTRVSLIVDRCLTIWSTMEVLYHFKPDCN